MIYEIESEPEEHSLTLSQHSSPSHSDQDQTPANKVTWLAKTPQLFRVVEQHGNQFDPKNIINGAPQDLYFLGENLNQRKPEKNRNGRNSMHDIQFSATDQIPSEAGQLGIPVHIYFALQHEVTYSFT